MRKIALFLALVMLLTTALAGCTNASNPTTTSTPTQVPFQQKVEDFIKNSSTFKFDGIADSIKFVNIIGSAEGSSDVPVKDWEFTVEYQTGHPGHGDRTGQMMEQVATRHTAVIRIAAGVMSSAVCDKNWDLLNDNPLTTTITEENARQLAEEFIENSSTFKFDGIEGSILDIRTDPGWTSAFRSTGFTFEYKTRHPGHGDRSGKVLAEVVTNHTAVILVNIEKGEVAMAVCDKNWDMVNDKNPPISVTGTVVSGGDTTSPGGPLDAPRIFVYEVKRDDGTKVKVSYTAYPPSPVGDANRAKITLDFSGGGINMGDRMEALGRIDKETNTIVVADQGDYIRTYPATLSEEVSWKIGEAVVAATITRPNDQAVHPGIVFVAGSGPTDRNWNSPLLPGTNGSAGLLAEELAGIGLVTIRYDKIVAGPNAQQNLPLLTGKISMESHVDELAGAVDVLLARTDVNPDKIFVMANSEGTIHAVNYQLTREHKFAGIILEGMPGQNMADLMRAQLEAQMAALPKVKEIMAGYDKLMADFLAAKPFAADPALPEGINDLFQGFNAPINLPFTRELFALDPSPLIGKVTVPTLVMIGKKDIQVDYLVDGSLLEAAAKGLSNVSFVYPENANHVLKYEPRPREALSGADALTYNASDRVLDPEAFKIIEDWLVKS